MKSLLLLLALSAPAFSQNAEQTFQLPLFKDGLYTRYSANAIPDGALAEALNVTLDEDVDGVVVARRGYSKYNSSALANTKTVRGLWTFDAPDGTKYMVAFSSETFYKTSGDGTWTAITGLNGFSLTNEFDCVQTIGSLYCGNGDTVFYWNGTSTATVSAAPLGNLLGRFRNRLLIAGVSGSKARLRGSGELDTADWTLQVPGVSTTPFSIAFGGADDGEDITCLMGAFQDVFIVGKRNSLWGLYGFGRNDFQVRELSREVGCIESRSVREKNNCLYWMSLRGIEKFCGASIERIGDPIRNNIDSIVAAAGNARSALDTTQADFQEGNLTASGSGAPVSATILSNSVVPTTWTTTANLSRSTFVMSDVDITLISSNHFDRFTDGDYSANPQWDILDGTWEINGGGLRGTFASLSGETFIEFPQPNTRKSGTWSIAFNSTSTTTNWRFEFTYLSGVTHPYDANGIAAEADSFKIGVYYALPTDCIILWARGKNSGSYDTGTSATIPKSQCDGTHEMAVQHSSNGVVNVYLDGVVKITTTTVQPDNNAIRGAIGWLTPGGLEVCPTFDNIYLPDFYENQTSAGYDTGFSTPTWGPYYSTISSGTSNGIVIQTQSSISSGGSYSTLADQTPGEKISSPSRRFIKHHAQVLPPLTISAAAATMVGTSLNAATTGHFISQCRNTTGVSQWGLLSCNLTQTGGGSITLAVATGTTCDSVTRATATWTTTTNNTTISVATSAFVAYRGLFDFDSSTEVSSNNLAVLDCSIGWTEGSSRPPVASQVYRDRYYLAYTSSTATGSSNDHILVLDKNDKWTLFNNHPCYSMAFYNRKLYCGSATSAGQVWQLDQGTDDDGTAITSRIRTKAFNFGMPERRKSYSRLYLDLEPSPDPGQTITLTASYTLERSTPTYSLGNIDLNEDPGSIMTPRIPFPLSNPITGRYIQLDLQSSGLNSPWRLFGGRLYYLPMDPE